jgi:hypothetical protein
VNSSLAHFEHEARAWGLSLDERMELEELCKSVSEPTGGHQAETWTTFDFRNEVSELLISNSLASKGLHYRDCHRKGMVVECQGKTKHKFAMPYCCDLRFCTFCAPRHFMRLYKKHSLVLEHARTHPIPGHRFREITLTSLNTGHVTKEGVKHFNACVKKTLKVMMKGHKGWGALTVDEVGFNNTNLHAHILLYGPFILQDKLVEAWNKISGFQVAWIELAEAEGPKALLHLLKYVSKPPSNNPHNLAELETAFDRSRRVFAYGSFYNFKPDTNKEEETNESGTCPLCGAELRVIRELRPMSVLRAEGLPLLESVRSEREKHKWVN